MIQKFIDRLFGNYNQKQIEKIKKMLPAIHAKDEDLKSLTDQELQTQFIEWREYLVEHPSKVDEMLIDVFAGIKNAARRLAGYEYEVKGKKEVWNMVHYDVQLIGGIVLHQGKIAEMKTGEGKTLVCTLPVILNALTGKGVHVVTVNDYLSSRDAEWMTPLYNFCGLTVGIITNDTTAAERKIAYDSDITYGTNNEFGFDYLRDNMAQSKENIVQRELHYSIVDEVDSILIDEARTPLIISAPAAESVQKYEVYADLVKTLKENEDFNIDLKNKQVTLSEAGIANIEAKLGIGNIFTEAGFDEVHHIESALKAQFIMIKDQDYVVRDNKVIIVDEFTGRLMSGRRFSDGLHQSLEAKEHVEIQRESKTLATITFQNYFRLYDKLSGMTGTAETEAEEFAKIYKLDTLVIPTNKPIQRIDLSDKIFKNEQGKYTALTRTIKELNEKGQPILIGTVNIDKSEALSAFLTKNNIKHNVLNAKHHENEAEIVASAGRLGSVTIATNMAGRGTDIKISDEVKALGGLAILGTERHESRRIDNQLRGRAGRQGDPGFTQFYVSMQDDLMRRFGGERMANLMERLGLPDDEAIENSMISKSVENAQKKIEGFHFDSRKHVVQYDDVMNIHREKIYTRRRKLLGSDSILNNVEEIIKILALQIVEENCASEEFETHWDIKELFETLNNLHIPDKDAITIEELEAFHHRNELIESVQNYLLDAWDIKKSSLPEEIIDDIAKQIILRSIDELWLEHIDEMTHLKDRVALSGYAQKDPIMEYKAEAFRMFSRLLDSIRMLIVSNLFRVEFTENLEFHDESAELLEASQSDQSLDTRFAENLSRAERRRLKKLEAK